MTRLAQTVSLLAGLYMLTSVATTYAECAWVLWREEETVALASGAARVEWAAPIAYPDRVACVAAIDNYVKSWQEGRAPNQTVDRMPSGTAAEFRTQGSPDFWTVVRRYCLPDTVDPREPKAK